MLRWLGCANSPPRSSTAYRIHLCSRIKGVIFPRNPSQTPKSYCPKKNGSFRKPLRPEQTDPNGHLSIGNWNSCWGIYTFHLGTPFDLQGGHWWCRPLMARNCRRLRPKDQGPRTEEQNLTPKTEPNMNLFLVSGFWLMVYWFTSLPIPAPSLSLRGGSNLFCN